MNAQDTRENSWFRVLSVRHTHHVDHAIAGLSTYYVVGTCAIVRDRRRIEFAAFLFNFGRIVGHFTTSFLSRLVIVARSLCIASSGPIAISDGEEELPPPSTTQLRFSENQTTRRPSQLRAGTRTPLILQ